jgi:hypothetical protein
VGTIAQLAIKLKGEVEFFGCHKHLGKERVDFVGQNV